MSITHIQYRHIGLFRHVTEADPTLFSSHSVFIVDVHHVFFYKKYIYIYVYMYAHFRYYLHGVNRMFFLLNLKSVTPVCTVKFGKIWYSVNTSCCCSDTRSICSVSASCKDWFELSSGEGLCLKASVCCRPVRLALVWQPVCYHDSLLKDVSNMKTYFLHGLLRYGSLWVWFEGQRSGLWCILFQNLGINLQFTVKMLIILWAVSVNICLFVYRNLSDFSDMIEL